MGCVLGVREVGQVKRNLWGTYIGGFYTPQKFVEEAKKIGVSRRIPYQQLKGMEYGDVVVCLKSGKPARAFAAFQVTGISMPADLDAMIRQEMKDRDMIDEEIDAPAEGGQVVRECGSYSMGGGVTLKEGVTLHDVLAIAEPHILLREECPLFVLGKLVAEDLSIYAPDLKFVRGFFHLDSSLPWYRELVKLPVLAGSLMGIEHYQKRETVERKDLGEKMI